MNFKGNFLESFEGESQSFSVSLDDDLGVHALFNKLLGLLQEFSGKKHDGGGSVTDFIVLRSGDVNQSLGGWVDDI